VLWYILLRFLFITSIEYFKYILSIQTIIATLIVGLISVVVYKNRLQNTQDSVILWSGDFVYFLLVADSHIGTLDYSPCSVKEVSTTLSLVFLVVATSASFIWCPAARIVIKAYTAYCSNLESRELLANS